MGMSFVNAAKALASLLFVCLPLILGILHSAKKKQRKEKILTLLNYYLFIGVGIQGVLLGIISMPSSSQLLVSANFACGIAGLLSPWLGNLWKNTVAICYGVILLLQLFLPIDALFWSNLFLPTALFLLVGLQRSVKADHTI